MKLFIREHSALLFIYLLQVLVTWAVYWLDGVHASDTAVYAALLSGVLLAAYLAYRYISNRSFYRRLTVRAESLTELTEPLQQAPLPVALQKLHQSHFRLYQSELLQHKRKNEEHIQFINQWVHQMKTPISVIHLLIHDEDDGKFAAIGDELDRLRKGLETVLYTSRLDTFEHDFHVETIGLRQLVRSTASNQKRLFIRSGVFPHIDIDEQLTVSTDEKWLSFVITQLITNAIRYTEGEGRKVYFRGYPLERGAALEIKDEGIGIPKSDLPKVFEAYFTGENGRKYSDSTGMGLYLVRQICEKLGHEVRLESAPGEGTTVTLLFGKVTSG
ncbi:sensor histidine kinase [Paenibacillus sp. NPDC058071]|uniref:sensor histidine kinase n=1 Tax=Paenibacillus sp. NPDC058071 TaxID=3346326 RepID=UPI0036DAE254